MSAATLLGVRVLIVDDEYLLADDLARGLRKVGAVVIGPIASVKAALALIGSEPVLHGAILGVPNIFATGYDVPDLLPGNQDVPRCAKPVNITALIPVLVGIAN